MSTVAVFGLGYVGSEVAILAHQRGFNVVGIDSDKDVIRAVKKEWNIAEENQTSFKVTSDGVHASSRASVIIITVPTPLDSSYSVDLSAVKSVTESIAKGLPSKPDEALVVIESTIPPGTIPDVISPVFEGRGYEVGRDIYLAHAPERVDPGNKEWSLEEIPRVIGAMTDEGREAAVAFYKKLLDAPVHPVSSTKVAASSKIIENSFRDINIAFVNELSISLDELGIDTAEALDAANTKPFGFMRFSPGAGVGGHCIPIDPYFLIEKATSNGLDSRFLQTAREVNDRMPEYVAEKTIDTLLEARILPQDARVLLLGKAFKPNVPDERNSPYFSLREELEDYGATIETYDPVLSEGSTVDSPYSDVDAVVIVTDHDDFEDLKPESFADVGVKVVVDGRNVLEPDEVRGAGLHYAGVGRT